ncbi:MAG: CBS domain-containing protein [archaeon]
MAKKYSVFQSIDKMITDIPITEIMTKSPVTMKQEASVEHAVNIMALKKISSVLVVDSSGNPVGLVSDGDVMRKVIHKSKNLKDVSLKEIMSKKLKTISPETSIGETSLLMKRLGVGKFPIMQGKEVVGFVTKSDILKKLNEIYYQNSHLRWFPIVIMMQLIIITVLILLYINK